MSWTFHFTITSLCSWSDWGTLISPQIAIICLDVSLTEAHKYIMSLHELESPVNHLNQHDIIDDSWLVLNQWFQVKGCVKHIFPFKDVLMGIPERDLIGMTVAVLQKAGYWFSAVWNRAYSCEIRVIEVSYTQKMVYTHQHILNIWGQFTFKKTRPVQFFSPYEIMGSIQVYF